MMGEYVNEDWYRERGRGKIERGRGKITGRKERKKKIQLHLWDSNPQPRDFTHAIGVDPV